MDTCLAKWLYTIPGVWQIMSNSFASIPRHSPRPIGPIPALRKLSEISMEHVNVSVKGKLEMLLAGSSIEKRFIRILRMIVYMIPTIINRTSGTLPDI